MGANMNRLRRLAQNPARDSWTTASRSRPSPQRLPCYRPPRRRHSRPSQAPSAADQNCLGCHGAAGMEKKLADGDTLQLHVPADPYRQVRARRQRLHQLSLRRRSRRASARAKTTSRARAALRLPRPRSAAPAMPTNSSNGRAAFTARWCATAIRRRRSAPTVIIRMRSSRMRRRRSTRFPARSATRRFTPPISAACTRNRGSHSKDSYAPICSGCHTAHAVKPISVGASARVRRGLFRLSCRRAGSPPEMAAQRRFAFRSRVLPGLPRARRATQSRSHADRQQGQGARDRTNRRAAVRCQHQFGRQGNRCADAVESAADAQSQRHRRQDRLARPPGRSSPARRRINSPTRARRSATAAPVIARDRRPSRA